MGSREWTNRGRKGEVSLRVWLPLTKDLRNQGLDDVTVMNNGATFNSAGKLGGAYEFASGKRIQTTLPSTSNLNSKAISFACWVNISSWNSSYDCLMSIADGTGWNQSRATLCRNNTASTLCWNIADGSTSTRVYTTTSLSTNTWYHIACTYDGASLKIYVNGVLNNSAAATLSINYAGTFNIGGWSGNNYPLNAKLNDVRIYSHCLSPMEVKELSKGLVLHYPLDRQGWGQENLVWNSNWNIHSTTPPESWVNWGSPPTREIVTIDGKNWLHVISNTTQFQGYSQNWTKRNGVGELTANTKMTVSFTAKLAAEASIAPIGIHWCNSSGTIVTQNWTTTALTTSPKRYSFTYTTPADCVAFNIMVGDNTNTAHEVWVTDIKLEFGEIATPWCPNSSDTLATTMGLNSTTEYDCSGFCNNGTRTGTFTWTSDTPKYAVSTTINSSKIQCITNPITGDDPIFSIGFWFKLKSNISYIAYADLVSFSSSSYSNQPFRLEICGNPVGNDICWFRGPSGNTGGFKINTSNLVRDTWYYTMLVSEGNKQYSYYINGIKTGTYNGSANSWIPTNIFSIGDGQAGAFDISDVRIYATALSADDVQSLYQNSAYIDSSGNVYGAVHSEV